MYMRFDVITIFPGMFTALTGFGVTGRAVQTEQLVLKCWNPRDFAEDAHRTVDDRPYGGGPGMVMMADPLALSIDAIRTETGRTSPLIPRGRD